MKQLYLIIFLFLINPLFSQQILRVNENSSSFFFSEAEMNEDSMIVYYVDSLDHQYFHSTKNFKEVKFSSSGGIVQNQNNIIRANYMCLDFDWVPLDSTNGFKVGTEFNDISTSHPIPLLWYKYGGQQDFDSLNYYQFNDSTYTFYTIRKFVLINGSAYTFGGAARSDYPFIEMFIIKHNLSNSSYVVKTFEMPTALDLVSDIIYDGTKGDFIITTTSQIGSGQIPYGAAISKIDTNLRLDTSSVKTMQVNYSAYLITTPNPYNYHTALCKLDSSKFLIIGCVQNQSQLNLPNGKAGRDFAIGQRDLDSLKEIGSSKIIGKRDTIENLLVGDLKLKKIRSNRYLTLINQEYNTPEPEPWNTTASVYGIDAQANKRWEYHLDMQDYCWVRDFYPSNDGGLWIINQCSENLDPINGTYDYFIKVAYLDSSVFWPGVLTDVVEPEQKAAELKIFPNPVSEQLNIEQYGQIVPLEGLLFNMNGRLLERFPIRSHENQIPLDQIKPGNCILKIIDAKGREVKTEKIVVVE